MKQELEVLEQINHPYIVRVLDLFEDENNIYVAQEILPYGNLLEVVNRMSQNNAKFSEKNVAGLIQ